MWRVAVFCLVLVVIHLPVGGAARFVVRGQPVTRVRFDFTAEALADANGRLALDQRRVEGGRLRTISRGGGWAIQFPPVCRDTPESCPRVILETGPASFLNPRGKRVKWGASVRLEPGMTANGENVIQKGISAGAQYKLQVDGVAGHPSCVISGTVAGGHRVIVATSPSGVADGAWHSLTCERYPGMLRLMIDGGEMDSQEVPVNLEIANDLPLRIGGKGTGADNDQFHGALDDVFVEIG